MLARSSRFAMPGDDDHIARTLFENAYRLELSVTRVCAPSGNAALSYELHGCFGDDECDGIAVAQQLLAAFGRLPKYDVGGACDDDSDA